MHVVSAPRQLTEPTAREALNLAAGWYVAMPSRQLGSRPRALTLFGRPLVAWRDARGAASLMRRHCPHMGASLADGRIVDGLLQCPFHGWRFDALGTCQSIPGPARIPAAASRPAYPTVERYGYLWAWYGGPHPLYPLPELPAAFDRLGWHRGFRLADRTRATARRILENTYDPDHLVDLHGLEIAGPMTLRLLDSPVDTATNGPPIVADAWFGAELTWPRYIGRTGAIAHAVGVNADSFLLRVDGWPAGQRVSYYSDGVLRYQLLLAVSPVGPNETIQHIAVAVTPAARAWKNITKYLVDRLEVTFASNQDLPVFDSIRAGDRHGIYLESEYGLRAFRKYYQSWVDRVSVDA